MNRPQALRASTDQKAIDFRATLKTLASDLYDTRALAKSAMVSADVTQVSQRVRMRDRRISGYWTLFSFFLHPWQATDLLSNLKSNVTSPAGKQLIEQKTSELTYLSLTLDLDLGEAVTKGLSDAVRDTKAGKSGWTATSSQSSNMRTYRSRVRRLIRSYISKAAAVRKEMAHSILLSNKKSFGGEVKVECHFHSHITVRSY